MTRLEASAWPLAGGSGCAFALAILLAGTSWQPAFAAVVLSVCCWSARAPVVAGVALGAIGWLCVTGFDVDRLGDIRITGREDAVRAVILLLAGVVAASAHAVAARRKGLGRDRTSGAVTYTGAALSVRTAPVHLIEERRDGRPGLHPADSGDLRPARPAREGGRTAVSGT